MNVLFGIDDVDLQLGANRSDPDVVIAIPDIDESGVWIVAQFRSHDLDERQEIGRVLAGFAKVVFGNKVHGHGHRCGRQPKVDMRAARAVFIDIHADDAFAEGIDGSEGNCASRALI